MSHGLSIPYIGANRYSLKFIFASKYYLQVAFEAFFDAIRKVLVDGKIRR